MDRLFPKTHQNQNFFSTVKIKNDLKILLKAMISTQNSAEKAVSFWELTFGSNWDGHLPVR
jgi:hypothetical protein